MPRTGGGDAEFGEVVCGDVFLKGYAVVEEMDAAFVRIEGI